jgi:adenylosuccinate synthase
MVDVILGLQWGDEGKGKIVDYFAPQYDVIARFQGGPNAGHTLYVNDKKIVLHQIPSGIFHDNKINLIGNGVVLDPVTLKRECETVKPFVADFRKNLYISQRAHVILPTHRALDKASEQAKGNEKIGSTLKGIGPAYMDKTGRNGIRVGDILSIRNCLTA